VEQEKVAEGQGEEAKSYKGILRNVHTASHQAATIPFESRKISIVRIPCRPYLRTWKRCREEHKRSRKNGGEYLHFTKEVPKIYLGASQVKSAKKTTTGRPRSRP
jgi:hypothetical protein